MKLKKIYKELQKKQMSQLKETMKQQSNIAKDDSTTMEDEQGASVEESTSTKPLVDTPSCDENTVTVEIAMSTLPADEVEVRILELSFDTVTTCMYTCTYMYNLKCNWA